MWDTNLDRLKFSTLRHCTLSGLEGDSRERNQICLFIIYIYIYIYIYRERERERERECVCVGGGVNEFNAKKERLGLFWEEIRGREESCKVRENNTEKKIDKGNRTLLNKKTERYKENRREKVNK